MWINKDELIEAIQQEPWARELSGKDDLCHHLMDWFENHALPRFLNQVTSQVDVIIEMDPDLSEKEIFEGVSEHMVSFLGAHHASVRIYDPHTAQMLSFGSYPLEEMTREKFIPLEDSIAGEVVKTGRPYLVPDITGESRYRNKTAMLRQGVRSMMAVPLEIPRFFPHERDTVGVIQIYFAERHRRFTSLEIQVADLMARRLSFVIARKKIRSLNRIKEKRETIVAEIYRTLGSRGGVKLEEVYNRVIPELADMIKLQSSALFRVAGDMGQVVLEAGYPLKGYHGIGKSFAVESEPVFELILNLRDYTGEMIYEIITPDYVLVVDPQRSQWISEHMKRFARQHNINSILYVPLSVDGEVRHFMTFDALDQRQRYVDDEIETLLYLGREMMKAERMERLDDALHDFKNPAIAIAGFARRLRALLEEGRSGGGSELIRRYADILVQETSRLQELALSIYQVGEEQVLPFTEVLQRRFEINREAIREQLKQNVILDEGPFDPRLQVKGYMIHLERVFDNLLNNATKAIPLKGGRLGITTYAEAGWACAEITNTGRLPEEDRLKILEGEGEGRGLYITHRIIRLLKGKIEIQSGADTTSFLVKLPLYDPAAP